MIELFLCHGSLRPLPLNLRSGQRLVRFSSRSLLRNRWSPIILNKQVLVQRKPEKENDSLYIHSQLELARKTLHLVKNSPAILRIHNLSNEIGDTIYIKEVEKYGQEQLLAMVAHGDIDYAVCDESIAKASINDFPQLDIETAISFSQFYSWGVSKHSPILLDSLNSWLNDYVKTPAFKLLRKKYYNNWFLSGWNCKIVLSLQYKLLLF